MHYEYCPYCGKKLIDKEIGDEGNVPFCEQCNVPLFDMFSVCIIALVQNEYGEVALLWQSHCSSEYYTLVSGYMKLGETAEETAAREIFEELGVRIDALKLVGTFWFDKKDMLMLEFICKAKKVEFDLSNEVERALWVPVEKAFDMVHPKGSISYALLEKCINEMLPK